MKRIVVYIVIIVCSLGCIFAQSDENVTAEQNNNQRKKVGLVLSGGGAKGLAHIGVLKAFEQYGIPIDYIAGTSMGAIIGGLYAAGYTLQEIEDIFYSDELDEWLSNKIEDKYKSYWLRNENDPTLLNIGWDIDKNFKAEIPMSLINPIQMDFAFAEFFAQANEVCNGDYNNLMLPFFCIASDVGSRKQSVQRKGDLARSIRASMTFPFFFSPINIDGELLCDGGVYNNFPSYELNEFYSPDIIIGVKVAGNFDTPNEEDLLLYIENMIALDSRYEIPASNGFMLEPDMSFVSVMDFSRKEECIKRGYETAVAQIENLRSVVQDTVTKEQRNELRKNFNDKKKPAVIGNILVHGVNEAVRGHIEKLLTMNIHNNAFTLDDIKENYLTVASLPSIRSIHPNVYYDNFIKAYILDVNVKTKNILNTKIGGMLSTDPISNMFVGLEYNFFHRFAYKTQVKGYFGRYYAASGLEFRMDFPNPVLPFYLKGEININRWNFFRNRTGLFEYSANNYLVEREYNMQIKFGFPITKKSKFEFKLGIGEFIDNYFNNDVILSSDTNDVTNFRNFVFGALSETNSLDNNAFPTQGNFIRINAQLISGQEDFSPGNTFYDSHSSYNTNSSRIKNHSWIQINLETKYFRQISKHYSAGLLTKTFYSFQELFSTRRSSLLNAGVFAPTLETYTRFYPEYRANQFFSAGTQQVLMLGSSFLGASSIRLGAYAFLPVREILANNDNIPYYSEFFTKIYKIASLSFVTATPLGNLSLSLSYTQRENPSFSPWNISLSFGTILFNNKNIDK